MSEHVWVLLGTLCAQKFVAALDTTQRSMHLWRKVNPGCMEVTTKLPVTTHKDHFQYNREKMEPLNKERFRLKSGTQSMRITSNLAAQPVCASSAVVRVCVFCSAVRATLWIVDYGLASAGVWRCLTVCVCVYVCTQTSQSTAMQLSEEVAASVSVTAYCGTVLVA